MSLYIVQRVLHDVMFSDEIFQFATVSVLLNALSNDAETVQVDLLVLSVFKVISDTMAQTTSITVILNKQRAEPMW